MLYKDLKEFKKNIKKNKRIIGIDVGTKTIGVSLSDKDHNIATPKFTIKRKSNEKDIKLLMDYIKENNVCAIVSGIPLNSEEKDTKCSIFIKNFLYILNEKIDIPIYLQNEHLTSFEAENFLIGQMSIKFKKVKKIVDKVASHYILQNVLDSLKILE